MQTLTAQYNMQSEPQLNHHIERGRDTHNSNSMPASIFSKAFGTQHWPQQISEVLRHFEASLEGNVLSICDITIETQPLV